MDTTKTIQYQCKALVISEILQAKRSALGLSQRQVAESVGVTTASISYYESGKRTPSLDTLILLKGTLKLSIRDCVNIIEAISNGIQRHG